MAHPNLQLLVEAAKLLIPLLDDLTPRVHFSCGASWFKLLPQAAPISLNEECAMISPFSRLSLKQAVSLLALLLVFPLCPSRRVIAEERRLPADEGIAGLEQALRKLRTTARMTFVTAHPDDEDAGMLTLEARGHGASVTLVTLNRGEGGQNRTGSELFDALGVLRTLELLAAGQYYGVEQRFTKVADFGFSKNAEETLNKWGGHDSSLEDIVRVIREQRPDVVVSRFQGTRRDGHGNHQAAGMVGREAFKAAADPSRFPQQLKEGLLPWQAKKLYMDNVRATEDYTLRLDTGAYDPALGVSYAQFGLEGYSRQVSQGSGGGRIGPGHRYSYYKLLQSTIGSTETKEHSFYDGIDTSLSGLASALGAEESKVPFLKPQLIELEHRVNDATGAVRPDDPSLAAPALLAGLAIVNDLLPRIESSSLSPAAKGELLDRLRTKHEQFEAAANLALGIALEVMVDADAPAAASGEPVEIPASQRTFLMAAPGQTFSLTARIYNRSKYTVTPDEIQLELPQGWQYSELRKGLKPLNSGDDSFVRFRVKVPDNAEYTRPYWHRTDPQKESIVTIDQPRYQTLALPPWPVHAVASYHVEGGKGRIGGVAQVRYADSVYGQEQRPLAVGPPLSVELQPSTQIVSESRLDATEVTVDIRSNTPKPINAQARLDLPEGWKCEPASQTVSLQKEGEIGSAKFKITPARVSERQYEIKAIVELDGKRYSEGFSVVGRRDLGTFYYYRPAVQEVSVLSVKTPPDLKVGYLMGAGDEIPAVLKQVGVNVEMISPSQLAAGDLSRYQTIILGIRAYDVRSDVRDYNKRLLEYVQGGGTLVVQYNMGVAAFNAGKYTPYPAWATAARVTVEEAPVKLLDPGDRVFHYPNEIQPRDFDGWIQERGVYFFTKAYGPGIGSPSIIWDKRYKPLLSSHDPGELPLEGGLVKASYGKGTYIFTGYAFFRQLPAGVPGAVRLFVNIISAGHERQ